MMHGALRARWIPAMVVATLVAGCGDSGTDPLPDYDPLQTLDQLDAVLEPLDAGDAIFDGLWLATQTLDAYGSAPVASLLRSTGSSLLEASVPEAAALRGVARHHLLRADAGPGPTLPQLVFPSTLIGRTLVWDPSQGYVVDTSRTGAPTTGIRIIYYATDGSGYPATPLTPLGYIDLTDEDRSLAERVGVRVMEYGTTAAQDVERARYHVEMTVTGSSSAGTLEFESAGSINDGFDAVGFDLVQRFTWSDSQDYDRLEIDYLFEGEEGPVALVVQAESPFEASYWQDVTFRVAFGRDGTDRVELDVDIDASGGLDGQITRSGRTVIEISGTDGDPRFTRPRGSELTLSEINTLEQIWIGISDIITLTEWVLVPGNLLVLEG